MNLLEALDRGVHQLLDIVGAAYIPAYSQAVLACFFGCGVQLFLVASADHHLRALTSECNGNRAPNSASASGDNGNFVG